MLFLVFAVNAAGQAFLNLSTPNDESVVYFSSPVRLKGSLSPFYSKIYRASGSGVELVAEVASAGEFDGCVSANYYQLARPEVSLDGSALAYTATRRAEASRYCQAVEPDQGVVQTRTGALRLAGTLTLSSNGRFAITSTAQATSSGYHYVTDLTTSQQTLVAGAFDGSRRHVTNDGTILTLEPFALILTSRSGATRALPTQSKVDDAAIDPDGRTIVYNTHFGPGNSARLAAIDVTTGRETELLTGFYISSAILSSDGTTSFFEENRDGKGTVLAAIGVDGSNHRTITRLDSSISDMTTGAGKTIYAATGDSRLVRIDTVSGAVTTLVGRTPFITSAARVFPPPTSIAPVGSRMVLTTSAATSIQSISFCGKPVSSLAQNWIDFLVPWETPEGVCPVIVSSTTPFEHGIDLEVRLYDPQFPTVPGSLIHGDFTRLVSQYSPARPGEIVVAYMTGLGPVDATGMVAPGFGCRMDALEAPVLYAGLAPGLRGFYQVNIRVPAIPALTPTLTCGWDAERRASMPAWVAP